LQKTHVLLTEVGRSESRIWMWNYNNKGKTL